MESEKKQFDLDMEIMGTRAYRERLLADNYRPCWHFTVPDGYGWPGDPNGAFYADGRYHLMYLYRNIRTEAYHWGHISSHDLLHWRHHKDALTTADGDEGCFSGGAYLDDNGCAYLTFWKFRSVGEHPADRGGIMLARAYPPYEDWERITPVAVEQSEYGICDRVIDGETVHLACADPGNLWKSGEFYYMQTGNACVLDKYGRAEDSDVRYRGGWNDLFRSKDLKNWEYLHRLYKRPVRDASSPAFRDAPDDSEDAMCPSLLPLFDAEENGRPTGKYLQTFIAHNRGAQYYIGTWDEKNEIFVPERHGRFSWNDDVCFAPEPMTDGKNRQICWFWYRDPIQELFPGAGWNGVFSFPRCFWLRDSILHMAPARELENLLSHPVTFSGKTEDGGFLPIEAKDGSSARITCTVTLSSAKQAGIRVRADGNEFTDIFYDAEKGVLVMDTSHSGGCGRRIREEAPFLPEKETFSLDILIDRSVVEVYADTVQAISRCIYPTDPVHAVACAAFSRGGEALFDGTAYTVEPSNPY